MNVLFICVTCFSLLQVIAWGERTENQGAWEAASKPLDVEEPATAVGVSPYRPKDTR